MSKFVPPKVNDEIRHLMNLRREALNDVGPNSMNFLKIDKNFKSLLKRYDLIYSEYHIGFKSKN